MGRRRTWVGALLGALVIPLAVAGCGSGTGKSSSAVDSGLDLAAVVQATKDAGTAKVAGSGRSGEARKEHTTTFGGEVDFANDASRMGSTSDDLSTTRGDAIVVDGYTYIRTPSPSGVVDPGKPWARMRTPSFTGPSPFGLSDLGPVFGLLTRKGMQAEPAGSEVVRGVATDRYHLSMPAHASPKQLVAMGEDTGNPSVTFDLWIDPDHRIRRIGVPGSGDFTLELYDFGAPVSIVAPPAEQVGEVSVGQDLTGPWQLVGEDAGSAPWKVWIAPAQGGECFSVEVDDAAHPAPSDGGEHTPNGCSSRGSSMMGPDGTVTTPPTTPAGLSVQGSALAGRARAALRDGAAGDAWRDPRRRRPSGRRRDCERRVRGGAGARGRGRRDRARPAVRPTLLPAPSRGARLRVRRHDVGVRLVELELLLELRFGFGQQLVGNRSDGGAGPGPVSR